MRYQLQFLVVLLLVCGCGGASERVTTAAPAAATHSPGGPILAFHDVKVFDGARVLPKATVLVEGARIAAIGANLEIPAGARIIEGAGHTLLPGLIDAHAHVWQSEQLERALAFGVTTVLDLGSFVPATQELKRKLDTPDGQTLADFRTAGNLVTCPKGHGTEYGFQIRTLARTEDADAFVDQTLAEGADYIKIIYSIESKRFPSISRETLAAVIAAAHRRGKLAIVHIESLRGAKDALASGADGLAHGFVDKNPDSEVVTLAGQRKAFLIPTLSVTKAYIGQPDGARLAQTPSIHPYLSTEQAAMLHKDFGRPARAAKYEAIQLAIREFHKVGAAILAGSDAPNPGTTYGVTVHGELDLLVEAGLSPTEALAAATGLAAQSFRLTDRGRIAAGLRADLLLVKGDPTSNLAATRDIVGIWKNGVEFNREAFRARIAK